MPSDTREGRRPTRPPGAELIGAVLGDRYLVDSFLGAGGVGAVYRGTHLVLGTPVAIKVLLPQYAGDATIAQRFLREARAASLLHHPNALVVHDFGMEGPVAYMVMELLSGRDLASLSGRGRILLPPARVARLLAQVADAVAAAHAAGVVHRDLKPGNVMVEDLPTERDFVKVVDFGLARVLPAPERAGLFNDITQLGGAILGTPLYMAPEQALGREVSPATDVYALGVVLYELLAGRTPFHGELLQVLQAHIYEAPPPVERPPQAEPAPPEWYALVADCLAKDPAARPPDARAFRERLLGVHDAPTASAPPPQAGRDAPYAFAPPRAAAFDGLVVVLGTGCGAAALLRDAGARVSTASSALNAAALPATVVVLDAGPDASDAPSLLAVLKAHPQAAPVLVVTGDTRLEAGRALLAAGADDVAVPPIAGDALVRRVARLARRRR